jgi:hypothetical protein
MMIARGIPKSIMAQIILTSIKQFFSVNKVAYILT